MNADWIKAALDALKVGPLHVAAATGVGLTLLFGPQQLLHGLGVAQLAQDHRAWIGLGVLCCAFGLAAHAVRGAGRIGRKWRMQRQVRQRLRRLTEHERQILRGYVLEQTRTQMLRFDDGVVRGLEAAGVIYRSASVGTLHDGFAYNLTEAAWQALDEQDGKLARTLVDPHRSD